MNNEIRKNWLQTIQKMKCTRIKMCSGYYANVTVNFIKTHHRYLWLKNFKWRILEHHDLKQGGEVVVLRYSKIELLSAFGIFTLTFMQWRICSHAVNVNTNAWLMNRLNSGIGTFETFLWGYFFAMKNTENDSVNQAESADIKILIQFSGSHDLKIFSWNFKLRGWALYA